MHADVLFAALLPRRVPSLRYAIRSWTCPEKRRAHLKAAFLGEANLPAISARIPLEMAFYFCVEAWGHAHSHLKASIGLSLEALKAG